MDAIDYESFRRLPLHRRINRYPLPNGNIAVVFITAGPQATYATPVEVTPDRDGNRLVELLEPEHPAVRHITQQYPAPGQRW